jgi:hypothetical protein
MLIPSSRAREICALLQRPHSINFFALTYAGKPESKRNQGLFLEEKLNSNISHRYREAIEYKLKRWVTSTVLVEFKLTLDVQQHCNQQTQTTPTREYSRQ